MGGSLRRPAAAIALLSGLAGCGREETAPEAPTLAEAGSPVVRYLDARPPPESGPLVCGTSTCAAPTPTPLAPEACCTDTDGCGVTSTFAPRLCVAEPPPAVPDLGCPTLPVFEGAILQGCCTPDGQCGVLDRFGVLGCIPAAAIGREPTSCAYRGSSRCTSLVEIHCDGSEDCPEGLSCCGRAQQDRYDAFGCFPDCSTIVDGSRGRWLQICHPGQACDRPGDACTPSNTLPAGFARCSASAAADAGVETTPLGVRCGDGQCGAAEKCCLRPPELPYCAGLVEPCTCVRDVGAPDAESRIDASVDQ